MGIRNNIRSNANPVPAIPPKPKEEDDVEDYLKAFALLDIDNNGEITKADLDSFMKAKLGENPTETELQEMLNEVDVDGNGSVNFNEFLKLMKEQTIDPELEQDMLEAFLVFDTERNGFISAEVLKHVMTNIGESLTLEESEDFINMIDADCDGLVNYQELVKVLL